MICFFSRCVEIKLHSTLAAIQKCLYERKFVHNKKVRIHITITQSTTTTITQQKLHRMVRQKQKQILALIVGRALILYVFFLIILFYANKIKSSLTNYCEDLKIVAAAAAATAAAL